MVYYYTLTLGGDGRESLLFSYKYSQPVSLLKFYFKAYDKQVILDYLLNIDISLGNGDKWDYWCMLKLLEKFKEALPDTNFPLIKGYVGEIGSVVIKRNLDSK